MIWFQLALLGSLLYAISSILDKHLLEKYVTWSTVPLILAGFYDLLFAFILFTFFVDFSLGFASVAVIFAGMAYYMGNYFYYRTVAKEDISNIVPLAFVRPLFVAVIAGIFLGEVLGVEKYLGIFLIFAGAMLIGSKFKGGGRQKLRDIGVLLVGVFCWAMGDVLSKWGLDSFTVLGVIGYAVLGFGLCSIFLFLDRGVREKFFGGYTNGRRVWGLSFLIYGVIVSGWMLVVAAMETGPVSLVSAVISLQTLFVMLMTVGLSFFFPGFLKEEVGIRLTGMKLAAIALIIAGVYLIS